MKNLRQFYETICLAYLIINCEMAFSYSSSALVGYGAPYRSSTEGGSTFTLAIDTNKNQNGFSLGLVTIAEGKTDYFYRLSSGPRLTYELSQNKIFYLAICRVSETIILSTNSPSLEPSSYSQDGNRIELGSGYTVYKAANTNVMIGAYTGMISIKNYNFEQENGKNYQIISGLNLGVTFSSL